MKDDSSLLLANVGTLFLAIVAWLFAILAFFILWKIAKRSPRVMRFALKLKKKLFFGLILVTLLESYLELLVAAL